MQQGKIRSADPPRTISNPSPKEFKWKKYMVEEDGVSPEKADELWNTFGSSLNVPC